ncbi:PPK2 family polyphosphate kinase [Lutimonas vermicola]|uniref:PPK2 family polyphosphate kinase n=1 Tax=Lutimonas vermicola TaxID=414288 RepID=A0ABU9KXQ9_9FLAO
MKSITIDDYKVKSQIELINRPTLLHLETDEKSVEKELRHVRKKLGKLQDTLYAHGKYAVLICIQGMDTAGKDSLIREVFKDFNTRGIVVHSFKVPTPLELAHDYLWRHYIALPAKGKFGIFNRTHYENVLVTRVHPGYIMSENIPGIESVEDIKENFWQERFDQINNFEDHIAKNGTIIFKFFLHLSKGEQKNRLLRRLIKEKKYWKFSPGDLKERKLWDQYQHCYQEAINHTSKPHAPWYTIPADDKASARYLVARILFDTLKTYKEIREPDLDPEIKANLEEYIKQLNKD